MSERGGLVEQQDRCLLGEGEGEPGPPAFTAPGRHQPLRYRALGMALTVTPEPTRRLAPAARAMWRLEGLVTTAVAGVTATVVQITVEGTWAYLGWGVTVVVAVAAVVVGPEVRWRRWRWEVREHEIDLQRGTLAVTRTLVPMLRVQHVDTKRSMLQQVLGLATVVFHTAAGSNEIPALTVAEADQVRARIAALVQTADEL